MLRAVYLPVERAFIRYMEIPGGDPPVLWLHGWQCSSTGELLGAAVETALRGRRSLLIDFLGHGYSDKPRGFAYTTEAHAATIVALIDALQLVACYLVGHSMGGGIAIHVAAARPKVVSLLVMAEASIDADGGDEFDGQTEDEFVEHGFPELIAAQTAEAEASPAGVRAAHVEMTRLISGHALYRERQSLNAGTTPSTRSLLRDLRMPRWYLIGELSDPEGLEPDLSSMGVVWQVIPRAGHPMALQNPQGVAEAVAEAVAASRPT
jgi:pimeloyl-ACP methyl ester carboxylesterase